MQKLSGLIEEFGMKPISIGKDRVEMEMPICEKLQQPFGYLHGGATIALLETAASFAAELNADLSRERPFGIEVHVRHVKSGKQGTLRGVAELDRIEGDKQFWQVTAYDDVGDTVSFGSIVTKIVSLERLAEKRLAEKERTS